MADRDSSAPDSQAAGFAIGLPLRTALRPGDAQAAESGLARLHSAVAAGQAGADLAPLPDVLAADPAGDDGPAGAQRLLTVVFGNSTYLADLAVGEPAFLARLLVQGPAGPVAAAMAALSGCAVAAEGRSDAVMAQLRRAKRRIALAVGLADIADLWDLGEVTAALSDFAAAAVEEALACALMTYAGRGQLRLADPAAPTRGSGYFVLGVGKLGSRELNYSSDIDVVLLYDEQVFVAADPDKTPQVAVRVGKELVRLLTQQTRDGYVARVDLRLRPDPGATPLALSVGAAEAYYGSLGQNWERAAMIRARPVAGDMTVGARFADLLRPWVWRRSLDFAAIQDIQSIKRQIGAHRGHRQVAVAGHDIKVGRGGIREIEFYAQTQQLIYGGRMPGLRPAATLAALAALNAHELISDEACGDLSAAYRFLRHLEHRLQMVADQQTQRLPEDMAGLARLAGFLGYADADAFAAAVRAHLDRVAYHYARLFEREPALSGPGNLVFTGNADDPDTVATLQEMGFANPSAVIQTVRGWHAGRYQATRSQRAREILTELVPTLLRAFAHTSEPDQALTRFDAFLARVPAGVQLFSLFRSNPHLLDLVAEIVGTAPALAAYLSRNPGRFDMMLQPDFHEALPAADDLAAELADQLATARDFQDVLALTRRWAHDRQFQAGVHILRAISDIDRASAFLADVAAVAVDALIPHVAAEFARRHGTVPGGELAVLGLGRLGARAMTPTSDLDLVFIYDAPAAVTGSDGAKPLSVATYYTRLVQRIISALTVRTEEGSLYDVDMRLRPSGEAGPIATARDAFVKYEHDSAWTWEHMALTRARVVAGDPGLTARLVDDMRAVLARPRDPEVLRRDVAAMRARIDRAFGTRDIWDIKYVRGGFVDVQFLAQYLALRHGHDQPSVLAHNSAVALQRLAELGLLDPAESRMLISALRLYRRLLGFLRLTVIGRFDPATASLGLKRAMLRAVLDITPPEDPEALSLAPLTARLEEALGHVQAAYNRIVGDSHETPDS